MTVAVVLLALGYAPITGAFLWLHHRSLDRDRRAFKVERDVWLAERAQLLNRIKPETAQIVPGDQTVAVPAVPFEDDEAYWDAREEMRRAAA